MDRYEFGTWQKIRVNLDYHVEVDQHFYSVPYALVREVVDVRATASTVKILHHGLRVTSHTRSFEAHKATTIEEHRPKSHREYLAWTPSKKSSTTGGR